MQMSKRKNQAGFTIAEFMIGVLIMAVTIVALYGAILWGKYNTSKSQYIVLASQIGRHQVEIIKALGYTNATNTVYNKYDISSSFNNPHLAYGGRFDRTNVFSLDTSYDVESYFNDDSSMGAGRVVRVFTVNVYLRPANAVDTTVLPFSSPMVTYVTYLTPGGS